MPRKKPATNPAPGGPRSFPVYLELALGSGSKRALVQALERDGCYIGQCAREMIARASFAGADNPHRVKLARVQLSTLGVSNWVTWSDVL
jgi:hypothetical protein